MADYHYESYRLYHELQLHETVRDMYHDSKIVAEKSGFISDWYSDRLAETNNEIEKIKTKISELERPGDVVPDIIGTTIFEPETVLRDLNIGDSFYDIDRQNKYIKIERARIKNVISGADMVAHPMMPVYQRLQPGDYIRDEDERLREIMGDYEDLNNI